MTKATVQWTPTRATLSLGGKATTAPAAPPPAKGDGLPVAKPKKPTLNPHWLQLQWLTRAKGHEVTIELLSGRMVAGLLKSYDTYVLLVEADGSECLVYKHAISTMGLL